ncbi:hypothetical protein K466DRAFT_602238 [Polyporus arcularius HHB13444]|uniref:Uncharacterized protein n=1 Tax=Polyporus arcularius HHB13444 TaxID=1314778 RepID=A0A5C3P7F2_9APHY|nr:hypothetical protein K466DRAFT_602238 [Polyporus arcularius HHB13444]
MTRFLHPYPPGVFITGLGHDVTLFVSRYLDIRSLGAMRTGGRTGDRYVAAVLSRRLRELVRDFVDDAEGHFIEELHQTNSVVGSLAAAHFLHPLDCRAPSILAIFAPEKQWFHVVAYLVHVEQCHVKIELQQLNARRSKGERVAILTSSRGKINVVQSRWASPLEPIMNCWQSALYAYVTPTSFCDPYHELTRRKRGLINPRKVFPGLGIPTGQVARLISKWSRRGWDLVQQAEDWGGSPGCGTPEARYCAGTQRYFGDKFCLTGVIAPVEARDVGRLPYNALEEYTVLWWRGGETCGPTCHSGDTEISSAVRVYPTNVLRMGTLDQFDYITDMFVYPIALLQIDQ